MLLQAVSYTFPTKKESKDHNGRLKKKGNSFFKKKRQDKISILGGSFKGNMRVIFDTSGKTIEEGAFNFLKKIDALEQDKNSEYSKMKAKLAKFEKDIKKASGKEKKKLAKVIDLCKIRIWNEEIKSGLPSLYIRDFFTILTENSGYKEKLTEMLEKEGNENLNKILSEYKRIDLANLISTVLVNSERFSETTDEIWKEIEPIKKINLFFYYGKVFFIILKILLSVLTIYMAVLTTKSIVSLYIFCEKYFFSSENNKAKRVEKDTLLPPSSKKPESNKKKKKRSKNIS